MSLFLKINKLMKLESMFNLGEEKRMQLEKNTLFRFIEKVYFFNLFAFLFFGISTITTGNFFLFSFVDEMFLPSLVLFFTLPIINLFSYLNLIIVKKYKDAKTIILEIYSAYASIIFVGFFVSFFYNLPNELINFLTSDYLYVGSACFNLLFSFLYMHVVQKDSESRKYFINNKDKIIKKEMNLIKNELLNDSTPTYKLIEIKNAKGLTDLESIIINGLINDKIKNSGYKNTEDYLLHNYIQHEKDTNMIND